MWQLTHEGMYVKIHGSPEYRVFNMVDPENGILFELILQELGNVGKKGYEKCLKNGYLRYDHEQHLVFRNKECEQDLIQWYLKEIDQGYIFSKTIMNMLKKRNLIENSN